MNEPRELGIQFSTPMVRAILDGKKTQTRRVAGRTSRYGPEGTRLWVRETWADVNTESGPGLAYRADHAIRFCSDDAFPVEYDRYPGCTFTMWNADLFCREERGCKSDHHWRNPRFMPKWAARIWLEVTEIRLQRLRSITEADAIAEGCESREDFRRVWDGLYAGNPVKEWDASPLVEVVTFTVVTP